MTRRIAFSVLTLCCLIGSEAAAHEVRPAYLELRETAPGIYDALWKVPARGDGLRLALDVRLPGDAQNLGEPLGRFIGPAYVERWRFAKPGGLADEAIRIDGLPATKVDVLIRMTPLHGRTQTLRATPDAPEVRFAARAGGWDVSRTYTLLGIEHILFGVDHLLFVLALILLVQGWRRLVKTITAFTVAHSITLTAATLGFVRIPSPPVEACIALSIAFVAAELVRRDRGAAGIMEGAPWIVAFVFGLLHGLGFASALRDVGLPGDAIPLALLFFNVGVEIGQLGFIAAVLALATVLRRLPDPSARWSRTLLPYAIGSVAMFWVCERVTAF